jgi:hypothetical protein
MKNLNLISMQELSEMARLCSGAMREAYLRELAKRENNNQSSVPHYRVRPLTPLSYGEYYLY